MSDHKVTVTTDGRPKDLSIAPKGVGGGSSVNGGELLFAALATCFCNDLYREAAKRNITIEGIEVDVTGMFGGPGEPAREITYRAHVNADASQAEIDELIQATDRIAEIQNTVRGGCEVRLVRD